MIKKLDGELSSINQKPCISRIKLPDNSIYDVKDTLLRHQLNVLLGIEEPTKEENDDI